MNKDIMVFMVILILSLIISCIITVYTSMSISKELYGVLANVSATLIALPLIAAPIIGDLLRKSYVDLDRKKLEELRINELLLKNIYRKGWGLYILQISIIYTILPALLLLGDSIMLSIIDLPEPIPSIITLWFILSVIIGTVIMILTIYRIVELMEKMRKD